MWWCVAFDSRCNLKVIHKTKSYDEMKTIVKDQEAIALVSQSLLNPPQAPV